MATDPLAQAVMVAYCGWDPTTPVVGQTVNLDGNDTNLLVLPSLYVTAVTAVTVTDQLGTVYQATIDQPGTQGGQDVGWSVNGCLIWHPWMLSMYSVWPAGEQNVAVTYSGGYSSIPADLAAVLASLTTRMPQIQSGATSKRLGSATLSYAAAVAAGGLLLVEQMVLDKYRLPRVNTAVA